VLDFLVAHVTISPIQDPYFSNLTPPPKAKIELIYRKKKIFGRKKFVLKEIFGSKKFLGRKNFWLKKNFGQKKFLVKKNLCPKIFLGRKKKLDLSSY